MAARRTTDPLAMRAAVLDRRDCVICGEPSATAHHVIPRSQGGDDVRANLVAVCGSGTTGCHGLLEQRDPQARATLGRHLLEERHDVIRYVLAFYGEQPGQAWLERRLAISPERGT